MTTSQPASCFDDAEFQVALGVYRVASFRRGDECTFDPRPYTISRHTGEAYWSLTIRADGCSIRTCTGTRNQRRARAIARAMQADASAGRFAPRPPPSPRAIALIAALHASNGRCQRDRVPNTSATQAGKGQFEVRIPGSEA